MSRAVLAAAALLFVVGCGRAAMVNWKPGARTGTVHAPLCELCTSPYDAQIEKAGAAMSAKCGGAYRIEEEGTGAGPQETYYESRSDYSAEVDSRRGSADSQSRTSAGTTRRRFYFWHFRCAR